MLGIILMEDRRLRDFEDNLLRRRCRPKGEEVIGKWIKLHNDELHNFYFSPNIIKVGILKRMKWLEYDLRTVRRKIHTKLYSVSLKGRNTLYRPIYRWKNSTKVNFKKIESECVDWIQLARDRVQWQVLV